jgi:hypothetical protein
VGPAAVPVSITGRGTKQQQAKRADAARHGRDGPTAVLASSSATPARRREHYGLGLSAIPAGGCGYSRRAKHDRRAAAAHLGPDGPPAVLAASIIRIRETAALDAGPGPSSSLSPSTRLRTATDGFLRR